VDSSLWKVPESTEPQSIGNTPTTTSSTWHSTNNNINSTPTLCSICNRKFKNTTGLKLHQKIKSENSSRRSPPRL